MPATTILPSRWIASALGGAFVAAASVTDAVASECRVAIAIGLVADEGEPAGTGGGR